jgi:HlyD family secretion protein
MNQRRLKLVKRAGLLGAGVLLLLALAWAFVPAAITVETAPVARKPFEQTVLEDGKTRVKTKYVISTPVAGTLLRIDLKPGDGVTRGMTVATIVPGAAPLIDPRSEQELRARLGSAQAAQARAETSVGLARGEYSRALQLASSGTASQADLERAQSELRVRQKEYEAARFDAEVAGHEVEVARTALLQLSDPRGSRSSTRRVSVKSDVDGRVLRVTQESEATLPVGAPILELADAHDLEIVVDVLSTDGVQIAPGTRVRIERWGGPVTLEGRVRLVEPGAFTKVSALGVEEQRVNVILEILSPPERWTALGDGYRVEAEIAVFSAPSAVTVPISALYRVGDSWAVFELADGHARQRLVQLGRRNPLAAVVEAGLSPGQVVILYPGDQIRDGLRVTPR